jgi:dihydropyrimidinase
MSKILIKNGNVVFSKERKKTDILIEKGKISLIKKNIETDKAEIIDARGKFVFPGFIDANTRFDAVQQNINSVDDFYSGTLSALYGGVTTVIDSTLHPKGETLLNSIQQRKAQIKGKANVDYSFHCKIDHYNFQYLQEIPQIINDGILSFMIDTFYEEHKTKFSDREIMELLWKVKHSKGTLMFHAVNGGLVDFLTGKYVKYHKTTTPYFALSQPAEAEIEAVSRLITLNQYAMCPIYFMHLTTAESLQLAHMAKRNKQPVFVETAPQYLFFDKTIYDQPDGHMYMDTPAFRSKKDNHYLWQAIKSPLVDVISSHHCAIAKKDKEIAKTEFKQAGKGLPGVETLFPLLYSEGVKKDKFSLERLVSLLSEEPARLFGLFPKKGILLENSDADLIIFNPKSSGKISAVTQHSHANWSPYENFKTKGKIESVMSRGRWLLKDESLIEDNLEQGQFVRA